jgi:hypothetical protein
MTMQTVLPPLLTAANQVWGFDIPVASPTFITNKSSTGPVATDLDHERIDGCIVLLPNADPGFDWIFSRHRRRGTALFSLDGCSRAESRLRQPARRNNSFDPGP